MTTSESRVYTRERVRLIGMWKFSGVPVLSKSGSGPRSPQIQQHPKYGTETE